MDINELEACYNTFKYGEDIFHTLMQKRVHEILLAATFYDAFIFEQDGRLAEQIFGEFQELHLTFPYRITSVPTGEAALRKLEERAFDLVITTMHIGEISPFELGRRIKARTPDLPVLLLVTVPADLRLVERSRPEMRGIDDVFLWNGNPRIFLAMIKYVEDRLNAEHDAAAGLVRVMVFVEDSIPFYSRVLPVLFREMMLQTRMLISEEFNDVQRNYRMRTRPKVLMAHTFEDALALCERYKEVLLCVLSDLRFPRQGVLDPEAGVKLITTLKTRQYDAPLLLQSAEEALSDTALALGVSSISKHSETFLSDLHDFIHHNLGFGDFVFRDVEGREIARAQTLAEFEQKLNAIPPESLAYHGRRNHFSTWLLARGEIQVAKAIRPLQLEDFGGDVEQERQLLLDVFRQIRERKHRGTISDFDPEHPTQEQEIARLIPGSLGGKGRGLAFLNALLAALKFERRFPDCAIKIPQTACIGAAEYDRLLAAHDLRERLRHAEDQEIVRILADLALSPELHTALSAYIAQVTYPLAVRSSGLLEDSQSQPFAGIYQTFMLPNNHPDPAVRQQQLEQAIKMVYASAFLRHARQYIERLHDLPEEERMAVIVQELVGASYGERYYPHISGVAQSHNYYPTGRLQAGDGIAQAALGLGQWVMEGARAYRFCPKYPKLNLLAPEDLLKNSQTAFYALDLRNQTPDLTRGPAATLTRADLNAAEQDGALGPAASVWDASVGRLRDSLTTRGPRVITFASILKYKRFPLADILAELLDIGEKALGAPVEIEFAVNLANASGAERVPTFYLLQIRPLPFSGEELELTSAAPRRDDLVLYTEHGMGNGVVAHLCDLVYVSPAAFDATRTLEIQAELQQINAQMIAAQREYILIGPGRWGSRDRFLGIPVGWTDISNARVIVEAGFEGFVVEPSQGTHFFHNVVAMNVGYFSVPHGSPKAFINWAWLASCPPFQTTAHVVHLRCAAPFVVKMFGKTGVALIDTPALTA